MIRPHMCAYSRVTYPLLFTREEWPYHWDNN